MQTEQYVHKYRDKEHQIGDRRASGGVLQKVVTEAGRTRVMQGLAGRAKELHAILQPRQGQPHICLLGSPHLRQEEDRMRRRQSRKFTKTKSETAPEGMRREGWTLQVNRQNLAESVCGVVGSMTLGYKHLVTFETI